MRRDRGRQWGYINWLALALACYLGARCVAHRGVGYRALSGYCLAMAVANAVTVAGIAGELRRSVATELTAPNEYEVRMDEIQRRVWFRARDSEH